MELAIALQHQAVNRDVRAAGINPDYWYPAGWANELAPGQTLAVQIWDHEIAIYRDADGQLHALADACPHKGVALHKGKVMGDRLACRYHGWEFNSAGRCVRIPYLPETQKLPCAEVRTYPVQERYNLIWVFPGDPAAMDAHPLVDMPEYGQPGWLDVPVTGFFNAHFSICNENSMDVFHGFLHEELQSWFNPVLLKLQETEDTVTARYQVSYKGWVAKFLGLSERADEVTTLPITVQYRYPHYYSNLEGVSSLYLMRLPVSANYSRSFALFFFRVRLPQWLLNPLKPMLRSLLQKQVLHRFLAQDIEMMESEQENYQKNPHRRYVEINPAIIAIQRLILRQYGKAQTTSPSTETGHKNRGDVVETDIVTSSSEH